jgi:hypothetical protein
MTKKIRGAGHVARMGENRNSYSVFIGEDTRKETTRKTKTKMDLRETIWGCMDWINLV